VYDFGGGTLDVSIIEIQRNHLRTISIAGNYNLGGQDIDNCVSKHFFEKFVQEAEQKAQSDI